MLFYNKYSVKNNLFSILVKLFYYNILKFIIVLYINIVKGIYKMKEKLINYKPFNQINSYAIYINLKIFFFILFYLKYFFQVYYIDGFIL